MDQLHKPPKKITSKPQINLFYSSLSMKCKLHPYYTGTGVCAACLHHRLLSLISSDKHPTNHKPNYSSSPSSPLSSSSPQPPSVLFPRSVSPYVPASSRKTKLHFFHTPQAGPTTACLTEKEPHGSKGKFSFLYTLFGHSSKDKVRSSSSSSWWMHPFARHGRRRKCHMYDEWSMRRCSGRVAVSAGHNLSQKLADTSRFQ